MGEAAAKEKEGKEAEKEVWPKHGFQGDNKDEKAVCAECQQPKDAPAHFEQQDTPSGSGSKDDGK